jgi:leucyl aminopeptidase
MSDFFCHLPAKGAIPIHALTTETFPTWRKSASSAARRWADAQGFTARPFTALLLPGKEGAPEAALVGVGAQPIWSLAHLPALLPAGTYSIVADWKTEWLEAAALGFALAQYQFTRYKSLPVKHLTLALPSAVSLASIDQHRAAIFLARDLINTPANDMQPQHLAAAARTLANTIGARMTVISGEDLLKKNYPAIHAVGRASEHPPCLIDLRWGNPKHKRLTLVGKGVCFDTGGLDLKPYDAMKLMKKDMGGAALMLALTQAIAMAKLPVALRLLIPAVENSVGANAFRPQDVLKTRKGLTMEIGSTDAEGRVILADALAEADSESPDLIIDAATLTGAARTALGPELPALYANDSALAQSLEQLALAVHDPLWHMPLWMGYDKYVNSTIADVTNTPNFGFAGSVTAALFLKRFVSDRTPWIHLDTYAWNAESQPGRPAGGEALGLRALFAFLEARYRESRSAGGKKRR